MKIRSAVAEQSRQEKKNRTAANAGRTTEIKHETKFYFSFISDACTYETKLKQTYWINTKIVLQLFRVFFPHVKNMQMLKQFQAVSANHRPEQRNIGILRWSKWRNPLTILLYGEHDEI